MKRIKSFKEAQRYINSFVDYEKKTEFSLHRDIKIERVNLLFDILGVENNFTSFIHVAGTKGKGSVCAFLAHILASAGYRVGLYTSPHISDFRERIKILEKNGRAVKEKMIPPESFARILGEFKTRLDRVPFPPEYGKVSFFEILTGVAFKYFKSKKVDFAVLETGLGGKLDATNVIINPLLCVITTIDYDHTHILGRTLKQIAFQKAGIVKRNCRLVCAAQKKEVIGVIKKKCVQTKSQLFLSGKDFYVKNRGVNGVFTRFSLSSGLGRLKDLKIRLQGPHQIFNASLAAFSALVLCREGYAIRERNIRQGLRCASIEARFQILLKKPLVIVDVAHNPSALKTVRDSVRFYFPSRDVITVFASSKDKDIKEMAGIVKSFSKQVILTKFSNPRYTDPLVIKDFIKSAFVIGDVKEALERAFGLYTDMSIILITGSTFLVADAKRELSRNAFKRGNLKKVSVC